MSGAVLATGLTLAFRAGAYFSAEADLTADLTNDERVGSGDGLSTKVDWERQREIRKKERLKIKIRKKKNTGARTSTSAADRSRWHNEERGQPSPPRADADSSRWRE
jgi:hypothetical protein